MGGFGSDYFFCFFERRNFLESDMGVSAKKGVFPPKWMVKIMEKHPMNKLFFGGKTPTI